jgi:hypothetical protein
MLVTLDYTLEVEKRLGDSLCAALELASFVSDNLHKMIKDSYEQTIRRRLTSGGTRRLYPKLKKDILVKLRY